MPWFDRSQQGADTSERLATMIDEVSDTVTYVGFALPSTATSDAKWRILKQEVSGTVTSTLYAGGTIEFVNVWNNRAALSYS